MSKRKAAQAAEQEQTIVEIEAEVQDIVTAVDDAVDTALAGLSNVDPAGEAVALLSVEIDGYQRQFPGGYRVPRNLG